MITSSLMGACNRVRTAGPRLPKAQRCPSASLQAEEAPLLPPFPDSQKVPCKWAKAGAGCSRCSLYI